MPGMMETVLDIGVNDETIGGLMRLTGNPRLAWDSYRRLIQGFAEVVQGLPHRTVRYPHAGCIAVEGVENERSSTIAHCSACPRDVGSLSRIERSAVSAIASRSA